MEVLGALRLPQKLRELLFAYSRWTIGIAIGHNDPHPTPTLIVKCSYN